MDRKAIRFPHGEQPLEPGKDEDEEEEEDDAGEAWFRQQVEVVVAEEDERIGECPTDQEVNAHWSRQLAELAERAAQLRRAAQSAP